MTIEQKAKRYDEALWKAGELYQPSYSALLEEIFPELIKYNDEKVRGAIIHFISHTPTVPIGRINKETMLTWLEKQGQVNETIISQHENKICKENNDSLTSEDARIKKYLLSMFSDPNDSWDGISAREIIAWLEKQGTPQDKGEISDGYHTFNELYYYRMLYNAAFFNMLPKEWVHKSKKHHDGEDCFGGGWFIVMANLPTGQVSNHYELKDWDLFQIPEKEVADKWDGHTPQEAADRLRKYLLEKQGDQATTKKFSTSEVIDIVRQALQECKSFSDIVAADKYAAEAVATVDDFIKKQSEQNSAWSEEDEKIRKMLIKFFSNGAFYDSSTNGIPDKDIVVWLEKQGKIVAYYKDRLDECSCKYFNKGYKHALENQGGPKEINID